MILKFFKILILSLAALTINLNANECKNKKLDIIFRKDFFKMEKHINLLNIVV